MLYTQQEILDIIENLVKDFENLLGKEAKNVLNTFNQNKLISRIEEVESYYKKTQFEKIYPNAMAEIISVKASAIRVEDLAKKNNKNMSKKLEFELLPLAENLRFTFYYYNWVGKYTDKKKFFLENEFSYYYRNRYYEESKKTGEYKYEISIIVVAFNKFEVTQKCITSLKKYLPRDISYELIFVNHGSSDGTKKYFERQCPHKQIDIEINGGGRTVVDRIIEGKYRLAISNDILITDNSIRNLYTCIKSDDRIGWVVPTTPNVSNLQTIESNYSTLEEMYQFAKNNNISDSDRWEEKPRLCNPVDIIRTRDRLEIIGKIIIRLGHISFPDDMISYVFRRNGYKLMLAKDAYCYHFGSVTIGEQMGNQQKARINYSKGRIQFIKQFGMDPWGYGIAYDVALMNALNVKDAAIGNILGINSGIGGNPLKIKSLLKEKTKIKDAKVTYITQFDMNWEDVKGLGDEAYKVQEWTEYANVIKEQYDFIFLENGINNKNVSKIEGLKQFLMTTGKMLVRVETEELRHFIEQYYKGNVLEKNGTSMWLEIIK